MTAKDIMDSINEQANYELAIAEQVCGNTYSYEVIPQPNIGFWMIELCNN